jgi:DNA topoisomerase-2
MAYKHEGPTCDQSIDLAFNKKRADDRKDWINGYEEGMLIDHTQADVTYKDFVDKELVLYAKANVHRSIPSMVDGFKPSQRKVLFGCFKKKLKNDCKVAQLTGYVAEHAAYHHGEAALQETIIGLAQDFVGSNNINLLVPQGQFGTRLQGGKDAASARYIYTRLAPVTRAIFKEADEYVLEYQDEEGMKIEPVWYCPIIPMVLVNGADGIGTGWSTSVPNFNPREIISNLRRFIDGKKLEEMTPWYQDFNGTISEVKEDGKCDVLGSVEIHSDSQVTVSELPVRKWTQDYREYLEDLLPKGEKTKSSGNRMLLDYSEHHTEKTVHFDLQLGPDFGVVTQKHCERALRLHSSIPLTNMMLFDPDGKIHKYESPLEVIKDFAKLRLKIYEKRKAYILAKLQRECEILTEKARFIRLVLKGDIKVKKRKIFDLVQDLHRNSFKPLHEIKGPDGDSDPANDADEDEADGNDAGDDSEEGEGE